MDTALLITCNPQTSPCQTPWSLLSHPKLASRAWACCPGQEPSLSIAPVASPCFLSPAVRMRTPTPWVSSYPAGALIELKVRTRGFPLQTSSRGSPNNSAHFMSTYCVPDLVGVIDSGRERHGPSPQRAPSWLTGTLSPPLCRLTP